MGSYTSSFMLLKKPNKTLRQTHKISDSFLNHQFKIFFGFSGALAFLSETVPPEEQSGQSSFPVQQACISLLLKKVYLPLPPLPPLLPQKALQPGAKEKKRTSVWTFWAVTSKSLCIYPVLYSKQLHQLAWIKAGKYLINFHIDTFILHKLNCIYKCRK